MRGPKRWAATAVGVVLLGGCTLVSPPLLSPTPVQTTSLAPAAEHAAASVGRLLSTSCAGAPFAGTGFVVGPGLVLTAAHVVDGARQVSFRLAGAEPLPAQVVGIDASRDTALVRVERLPGDVPAIPLPTGGTAVGTGVVALGYPLGESAPYRAFARVTSVTDSSIVNGSPMRDLVTADAALPVGLSGSPALDADGAARAMMVAVTDGRGGRDSSATVTLGIPAARLAGSLAEWQDDQPVVPVACTGEVDRGAVADPELVVTSTDADAPELAHTLWLLGRSINAGQYPSAAGMLTRSLLDGAGGAEGWTRSLGTTRWRAIEVPSASRDGDHATARARLRTEADAGCRAQVFHYRFVRVSGIWLVDAVAPIGDARAC